MNLLKCLVLVLALYSLSIHIAGAVELVNSPPIAKFTVENRFVREGEAVKYVDASYDPDGDKIVEWKWEGNEPFFSEAGEKTVSLQVKDEKGLWSKPCKVNLMIWQKVFVDTFSLLLNSAPIGKRLDFTGEEALSFQLLAPEKTRYAGPTLLLSDSPETIQDNGILYADNVKGSVRLFYYHENGTRKNKRISVIAENMEQEKVSIDILKQAKGGPSKKGVMVGQTSLLRYFKDEKRESLVLEPGETKVINAMSEKNIPYKHIVHEIMDVYTSGLVRFTYVVLDVTDEPLEAYQGDLIILPRDGNHPRGTFLNADRYLEINVDERGKKRISFGDNKTDKFQEGLDNLTGIPSVNHGNYGVLYTVAVKSPHELGAALVMKGGPYAGAVISTDGKIHAIPNEGVIYPIIHGAKVAIFPPSEYYMKKMKFMVPVAASTPIDLLMIQLDEEE